MHSKRKSFSAGVLLGMAAALLLLLLIAVVAAYSGSYNVAASSGHTAGVRWWLDTMMQSSVRTHADGSAVPPLEFDLSAGAGAYKSMCEHCHGGPGAEPAGWSRGMLPQPPHLVERASRWHLEEIFWIARHGIKYTGMPAFGATHDEGALWDVAAFVKQLPGMTPQQYSAIGAAHDHDGGHAGSGHGTDTGSSAQTGAGSHSDAASAAGTRIDAADDTRGTAAGSDTGHHDGGQGGQEAAQDAHPEHDH